MPPVRQLEFAGASKRDKSYCTASLLYLLQVADHCQIDAEQAVRDKLAKNAQKYPAKHAIARVSPARASMAGTHVLLDYENVQPSDAELRALVPDVAQVWVFHGPHQPKVEQRFASFGTGATAVPISKTGKNALDFHLSFYMGYIASRNPDSKMVVVANDKGYEPMLEHAKAIGFLVRRQAQGEVKAPAQKTAAKKVVAKKAPARKAAAKPVAAKTAPVAKVAPAQKAGPAKRVEAKGTAARPAKATTVPRPAKALAPTAAPMSALPVRPATVSDADIRRITENLRKVGANRPTKAAALRRPLKSLLVAETGDESIEVALDKLVTSGSVTIGPVSEVKYPAFESAPGVGSAAS